MRDNWLYFVGLTLLMMTWGAGLLQSRGFRCAGSCLGSLLSLGALAAFIGGFFVGPWWGSLVALPAMSVLGAVKLGLINAMVPDGDMDTTVTLRFASSFIAGLAGAACIIW